MLHQNTESKMYIILIIFCVLTTLAIVEFTDIKNCFRKNKYFHTSNAAEAYVTIEL